MEAKPCSACGRPADFSLGFLLSKYRTKPRQQKCTTSISYCSGCIQALLAALGSSGPADLIEPLREAYTAFSGHSYDNSKPKSSPDSAAHNSELRSGPTTRPAPEASCRPCLIACNSRKFTRSTSPGGFSSPKCECPSD
jgi:hypothetical protein